MLGSLLIILGLLFNIAVMPFIIIAAVMILGPVGFAEWLLLGKTRCWGIINDLGMHWARV